MQTFLCYEYESYFTDGGHKVNKIKETANTIANMQNVQKTSRLVKFKLDQDFYSK